MAMIHQKKDKTLKNNDLFKQAVSLFRRKFS